MGRILPAALAVFGLGFPCEAVARDVPSQPSDAQAFSLAIIDLRLRGRTVLASEVIAYSGEEGTVYLPVDELFFLLNFPIENQRDDARIEGWFLRENQRFVIDVADRSAIVAGRQYDLLQTDFARLDGKLFLRLSVLNALFSLNARFDRLEQVVNFEPPYLLPAEEEDQRRSRAQQTTSGAKGQTSDTVRLDAPYDWISWPHLRVDLAATFRDQTNNFSGSGRFFAVGDMLKMTGRLAGSFDSDGRRDARFSLERFDPYNRLLGPLGASSIQGGDIVMVEAPLIDQFSRRGVGVRIAREALNATGSFDAIDLIGDAPPAWQAELYRDQELLDFQQTSQEGRYRFLQVPLRFGSNQFRIELFGPSGERDIIERTIDIRASLNRPGQFSYAVTGIDLGASLFGNDLNGLDQPVEPNALGANLFGSEIRAQVGYGLSRAISLRASGRYLDRVDAPSLAHASTGVTVLLNSVLLDADFATASTGGLAMGFTASAGLGDSSITIGHERFIDYESGANAIGSDAFFTKRWTANFDGRFKALGWSLSGQADTRRDGGFSRNLGFRVSANLANLFVSHTVNVRDFEFNQQPRPMEWIGALNASGSIGPVRLRAGFEYDIEPRLSPRRVRLDVAGNLGRWFLNGSFDRQLRADGQEAYGFRLNRDWNGIRLGADLRYQTSNADLSAFFTLGFAFDRSPTGGGLRFGSNANSDRGTLRVVPFVDRNQDGTKGADEPYVPDVRVNLEPRRQSEKSDEGEVFTALPLNLPVALRLDDQMLDDPFLAAPDLTYEVNLRPGHVVELNLPLVQVGEAVISVVDGGKPIVGEIVTLVARQSGNRLRSRTAFDGQAFFNAVPRGEYTIVFKRNEIGTIVIEAGNVARKTFSDLD